MSADSAATNLASSRKWTKAKDVFAQLTTSAVAGATARLTSVVILHPFDVIKTRLQYQRSISNDIISYRNWYQVVPQMIRSEGFLSLYQGMLVRFAFIIPSAAFHFTLFEQFRRIFKQHILKDRKDYLTLTLQFAVGCTIRGLMTVARIPFDVVKQELQIRGAHKRLQANQKRTLKEVLALIQKERGKVGFMSGVWVTILRDIAFQGSYFFLYELTKHFQSSTGASPDHLKVLVAGAVAGALATIISLPFDVIKTRIQTQAHLLPLERYESYSLAKVVRAMWTMEGYQVFFSGLQPRVVSTALSSSITFLCYENLKKFLDQHVTFLRSSQSHASSKSHE